MLRHRRTAGDNCSVHLGVVIKSCVLSFFPRFHIASETTLSLDVHLSGMAVSKRMLAPRIKDDGFLSQYQHQLYQKLALAALTETVFKRPPHNRAMTFAAISAETKIKHDEIEFMIMKALSLGLLRGSIDQVAEIARINWVQPKVLDKGQIVGMRQRLKEWDGSVHRLGTWIEQKGQDVWAA